MNIEETDTPKDFSSLENIQMAGLLAFGLQEIDNWEESSMRTTVEEGRDV